MRQMTTLRGVLAGLALISLAGIAPALAQSDPVPQPGLAPVGSRIPVLLEALDASPRYAVIPRVDLQVPSDLPPVEVKPVTGSQPEMRGGASAAVASVERPAFGVGAGLGGPRNFGGASAAGVLPDRRVNIKQVRDELADVRADLGL